jgi:uncharacterized membrane protein required for colicin V production
MTHTTADMMSSIGTPQIIDIAIIGAVVLFGAAGFWRGLNKELYITASLLLGYDVTLEWAARWGGWLGDRFSALSTADGQYVAIAGTLLLSTLILGYFGCTIAALPPADLPGRFGGLVLSAANATFAVTVLIARARQLVLDPSQQRTLRETRIGDWLSHNLDWVVLALVAVGSLLLAGGAMTKRRRAALIAITGTPPAGASGFKVRRRTPLAPEAEKIDSGVALDTWPAHGETVPITRVSDPSRATDRPADPGRTVTALPLGYPPARDETMRCLSCGERITEQDRFCPRCGRLLISG